MRKQIACLLFCLCFTVNLLHAQETTSKINWFVGNTAAGEWIQYKRVWLSAGNYRFTTQVKADLPNQTIHFEINNSTLINGVIVPESEYFTLVHLGSIQLAEGYYDFKLVFETGNVNCDMFFVKKDASTSTSVLANDTQFNWSSANDGMLIAPIGDQSFATANILNVGDQQMPGIFIDRAGNKFTNEQFLSWYSQQNYVYTANNSDQAMDMWVAELVAAKVDFVFMHGRSEKDLTNEIEDRDFQYGVGALGGRLLTRFVEAVNRSPYAKGNIKLAYFQDNASYAMAYKDATGITATDWNDAAYMDYTWNHWFKAWYDNVPASMLYKSGINKVPIQLWTANLSDFDNTGNNKHILEFLQFIEQKMLTTYGLDVEWVLSGSFFDRDPRTEAIAEGKQAWFWWGGSTTEMEEFKGQKYAFGVNGKRMPLPDCWLNDWNPATNTGTLAPGNTGTDYFTSPMKPDGTLRIQDILQAGYSQNARWVVLESWSDNLEGTVFYRTDKNLYEFPNQSIALLREYADRNSESMVFEAEACDFFYDRSEGNVGGEYRYHWHTDGEPDLDIYRPLHQLLPKRSIGVSGSNITQLSVSYQDVWARTAAGGIICNEVDGKNSAWINANNQKSLTDLAMGRYNSWAIGTDGKTYKTRLPQGWTYNGCTGWEDVTSGLAMKDVDINMKEVWGIDLNGNVYRRDVDGKTAWLQKTGKLQSITVDEANIWGFAANGKIARTRTEGNHAWDTIPNPYNVTKIDAGGGEIWGVNAAGNVYRTQSSGTSEWKLVDTGFANVSVGLEYAWGSKADGTTYVWELYGFDNQVIYDTHTSHKTADQDAYSGTPAAIPGTIEIENFDTGGEGMAYHDTDPTNAWNAYRPTEGVDINQLSPGAYNIGNVAAGEWLEYTVNIAQSGLYSVDVLASTVVNNSFVHLELDGKAITGSIAITNSGDWSVYQANTTANVPLEKGLHILKFYAETSLMNVDKIIFTYQTGQQPFNGTPINIPGILEIEDFDNGGDGVSYHDEDATNVAGKYRTDVGVDIGESGDGGYSIGWTANGEWTEYTVNVATTGVYYLDYKVASYGGGNFYLSIDGVNITNNVNVPGNQDWSKWQFIRQQGINLTAGIHVLRFYTLGGMNIDKIYFSNTEVPMAGISMTPTTKSVPVYSTAQLSYTVQPANAFNRNVIWSSSNPAIATVDQNGQVTGVALGYARIIATSQADNTVSASCDVMVTLGSPLRIVPIGNSITQSNYQHYSYRYNLWKKMIDVNISFDYVGSMTTNFSGNPSYIDYKGRSFDTDNEGHWGITTQTMSENIATWSSTYTADMVLLHLGTNDIGNFTTEQSKANLTTIITNFRNKNPKVVVLLAQLIPRNGVVPTAYNTMVAQLATELNTVESPVILVDQATGFNTATDTWDGTHPNALGEEKMAIRWFEAIQNYLNTKPVVQEPYGGSPLEIPGIVEIEYYDKGGEGLAFHDDATKNGDVNYRPADMVDIANMSGGGRNLGNTSNGEWLEYTVDIKQSGTYNLTVYAASPGNWGNIHLELNDVSVTGTLAIPSTGSWDAYQPTIFTGINLSQGTWVLRFYIENAGFNMDKMVFQKDIGTNISSTNSDSFSVYPNPNNGTFYVWKSENDIKSYNIELLDTKGNLIFKKENQEESNLKIEEQELASGIYFLKITTDSDSIVKKIIKQ